MDLDKLRKSTNYNFLNRELLNKWNLSINVYFRILNKGNKITDLDYPLFLKEINDLEAQTRELMRKLYATKLYNQKIDPKYLPHYRTTIRLHYFVNKNIFLESLASNILEILEKARNKLENFFKPLNLINARLYAYREGSGKTHTPDRQMEAICYFVTKKKDLLEIRSKAFSMIKCFLSANPSKDYSFLTNILGNNGGIQTSFDGYTGLKKGSRLTVTEKWVVYFGIRKMERSNLKDYVINKKLSKYKFRLITYTGQTKLFSELSNISKSNIPLACNFTYKIDAPLPELCGLIKRYTLI